MTDKYMHPGYRKPYPIATVLRDLASQEGCDGEPYDAMIFAADRIEQLVATNEALTKERDEADDLAKAAFADGASNNIRLAETSYRVKWLESKLAKAVEIGNKMAHSIEGNYYLPNIAGEWRKVAAEIKLQSSEFATQKGESHE